MAAHVNDLAPDAQPFDDARVDPTYVDVPAVAVDQHNWLAFALRDVAETHAA